MPAKQNGFLQALDDMIRITTNGLTFGGADRLAGALGGDGYAAEQAKTAAARDRAGIAGDIAAFLGPAKGVQMGWQGLKMGAKAAPAVGRAIFSKGGALAAGALGAGAYNYGQRTGSSQAQASPAPRPAAKAAAPAAAAPSMPRDKMAGDIMSGLDALGPAPPTFESMVNQVAQNQGGGLSMRQMLGLAEVAQRTAPRGARAPRPGEMGARELERGYYENLKAGRMTPDEFEEKILQLNKAQYIDPFGFQDRPEE